MRRTDDPDRRTPAAHADLGAALAGSASLRTLPSRLPGGVLDPGPTGAANRTILVDSLAIMLAIVVPTVVATFAFAWWYRASNTRARYRPDWAFSGQLELVVWAIPLMVILLLGGVTWIGSHQLDPARPIASKAAPLEIQVVSLDWKWLFIYPDQRVATVNQLVVPVGVPLHFALTSASVMNAFFIPQLGSMIYTMNGMTTQLWLQADHAGTYTANRPTSAATAFPTCDSRCAPWRPRSSPPGSRRRAAPVGARRRRAMPSWRARAPRRARDLR